MEHVRRARAGTRWLAVAALALGGCAADVEASPAGLSEARVEDPTVRLGPRDDFYTVFDAGTRDAAAGLHDIPGRDDDRSGVGESDYQSPDDPKVVRCGSEPCREGYVCCPATQECVPRSCPGCCNTDAYHRFEEIEAMDPEQIPDIDPAGPRPPGDDGSDGDPPVAPPSDPDPGPMPPGPGAPTAGLSAGLATWAIAIAR
jgi:hypothetical protein